MPITTDKAVAVPNVDAVSISTFPTSEDHDTVADCSHWSSHRGCVIGSLVIAPHPKNRVISPTEHTRDATESDRRAEKRSAERLARLVEIFASGSRSLE